jgi:hypothetical protein
LGKHYLTGHFPNLQRIGFSTYFSDFSELLVQFNNWLGHIVVSSESFGNDFLGIVGTSTRFCAFHAPRYTNRFWRIKVEDGLGFSDNLLKVESLVDGSGESVNEIVLNNGYHNFRNKKTELIA